MEDLLTLDGVALNYHTKTSETLAVKNLSFKVKRGEFLAVIGPSGCGKTSILSMISGLIKNSEGKILLGGKSIDKRSGKIGYMFQKDELFPWRTVLKNAYLPLEINGRLIKSETDYVNGLFDKYGLAEFTDYYPGELSGGMRQRVALIRTLSSKPELLLLDEPFSALDYQTRLLVCDDVHRIIRSEQKTAILVTHDISEAISIADKIIVLTKRPATVKAEYEMDFDKSETPLSRREEKNFSAWFEILWKELNG